MNKTNVKRFFSILLMLCIFISYSSFVYASDESLYVWSSNSNTLNIVDNTTNSSKVTDVSNIEEDPSLLTNATSEVTDDNSLNLVK